MATFPAVIPDAQRSLTPGIFSGETFAHTGGTEVRFLTSVTRTADQLQLTYDMRNETTVNLFLNHYLGQEGGTIPFPLSSEALSGFTAGDVLAPAGAAWVYLDPPQIEHVAPLLMRVTIRLESVATG